LGFCVTFATSAVEGLHSFNAHHNQPRVTVDVHNQLPPIDTSIDEDATTIKRDKSIKYYMMTRFHPTKKQNENLLERYVIGQSTGAHA
jgi:hypothetical protein